MKLFPHPLQKTMAGFMWNVSILKRFLQSTLAFLGTKIMFHLLVLWQNDHCVNNIVSRLCKWTNKSWLSTGTSCWYQKNSLSVKQSLLIQNKCAMPKCNKYCATLNETLTGKSCMEITKSTCKAILYKLHCMQRSILCGWKVVPWYQFLNAATI